ncbi:hypothetical protein WJX77_000237 [Trebouxia sp. C0004]
MNTLCRTEGIDLSRPERCVIQVEIKRANKDFRSMSGGQGLLVALQPVLLSSRHPKVEAISKNYQQEDAIQKNPFKSLFLTVTVASSERDLCSDTAGLQTAQPELC